MICPNCESEYREGFTECSDCRIPLVESLPPRQSGKPEDFEEIKLTNDAGEIAVLKSVLESEEIEFVIHGENFARHFRTLAPLTTPRLMVRKEHGDRVREILARLAEESPAEEE